MRVLRQPVRRLLGRACRCRAVLRHWKPISQAKADSVSRLPNLRARTPTGYERGLPRLPWRKPHVDAEAVAQASDEGKHHNFGGWIRRVSFPVPSRASLRGTSPAAIF